MSKTEVNGTEFKACGCGCNQPVARKATFRPGHDAKMVSVLATETASTSSRAFEVGTTGVKVDGSQDIAEVIHQVAEIIESNYSLALSRKYDAAAHNAWVKVGAAAEKKEAREAAKQGRKANRPEVKVSPDQKERDEARQIAEQMVPDEPRFDAADNSGEVKVGRWTYPARMTTAGKAQRNEKRDGSGSWVDMSADQAASTKWAF